MKKFLVFASLLVLTLLITLSPTFVYANDFVDNSYADEFGYYDYYFINAPDVVKFTNSNEFYMAVIDTSKSFLRNSDEDVPLLYSNTLFYDSNDNYLSTGLEVLPSQTDIIFDELYYSAFCNVSNHESPNVLYFEYNNVVLTSRQLDMLTFEKSSGGSFTFGVEAKFKFLNDNNSLEYFDFNESGSTLSLSFNVEDLEPDIIQNDLIYIEFMSLRIDSNNVKISGLDLIPFEDKNVNINAWEQEIIDQFNRMDNFEVGNWLLDNINSFLAFELFPNFTLANLLWFVILVPLLIFLLKMFLGG